MSELESPSLTWWFHWCLHKLFCIKKGSERCVLWLRKAWVRQRGCWFPGRGCALPCPSFCGLVSLRTHFGNLDVVSAHNFQVRKLRLSRAQDWPRVPESVTIPHNSARKLKADETQPLLPLLVSPPPPQEESAGYMVQSLLTSIYRGGRRSSEAGTQM